VARETRVKICGLRRAQDVSRAVRLGADFVGLVFAGSSPRALDPSEAERLLADLDTGAARRVGVFQDQALEFIQDAVRRCRLDVVQLHGSESKEFAEGLEVPVIAVIRTGPAGSATTHEGQQPRLLPSNTFAVLIDALDERGRSGGLGLEVSEAAFETIRAELPDAVRVFLAGGLTPENVAARVARHHPYAVDVSSGVESAPGVKDARRMQTFVDALRESA
jgi:phosphoribosylanthranilate isomerase